MICDPCQSREVISPGKVRENGEKYHETVENPLAEEVHLPYSQAVSSEGEISERYARFY
jgi:hypothetical protein